MQWKMHQFYSQRDVSVNFTSVPYSLNKSLNLVIVVRLAERSDIGGILMTRSDIGGILMMMMKVISIIICEH